MRVVHVLFTGGTISMQWDRASGGNVPVHGSDALLALVPELRSVARVRGENWARLPACHLGQSDHWRMRERVRELSSEPGVDGIVITHGTDTLEETAYLLDRTLTPPLPVVLTGAMRTSEAPDWDGARNLTDAVRVAAAPGARGQGVLVVFAGSIWRGRNAVKVDTVALDAFGAPHAAAAGRVLGDAVEFVSPAPARGTLAPPDLPARVALVPMAIGDDGAVLDLLQSSFDGVVIEAFGSGNLPPGAVPAIGRWLAAGKPVVLASRCPLGVVTPVYAFDGGGARLVEMGVVPAGQRTAAQARWELTIALSAGRPFGSGA